MDNKIKIWMDAKLQDTGSNSVEKDAVNVVDDRFIVVPETKGLGLISYAQCSCVPTTANIIMAATMNNPTTAMMRLRFRHHLAVSYLFSSME